MDLLEHHSSASSDFYSVYRLPQLDTVFEKVCQEVIATPQAPWSVPEAAAQCGYSVYHFSRTFKAKSGLGFPELVNRVRSIQAVMLMCKGRKLPDEALESVGMGQDRRQTRISSKNSDLQWLISGKC